MQRGAEMSKNTRLGWLLTITIAAGFIVTSCGGSTGAAIEPPMERTIHMAAIEPKGSTTVDKELFPARALPGGAGYGLKPPDETGKWVVETYRYSPGTVVVNEGDTVNLEIVGINGIEHPFHIEGYGVSGVVKRGEVTTVSFLADKPGIFKLVCELHRPTMEADIVVLKR